MRGPQIGRLGCAGVALIVITALTTVGVYAVVAGGVSWATASARTALSGVPVLVTIQAAPATPTTGMTAATPTPGAAGPRPSTISTTPIPAAAASGQPAAASGPPPAAGGPALAGPPAVLAAPAPAFAPAPPVDARAAATPMAAQTASAPLAAPATMQPTAAQAQPLAAGPTMTARPDLPNGPSQASPGQAHPAQVDAAQRAAHDGLTLEIVQIERGWRAPSPGESGAGQAGETPDLVTVQVRVVNDSAELRYLADTDLILVTEDGARLAPRQLTPRRAPHLLTVPVPPRDAMRGWLTYEIPTGLEPKRLQWSPTRPDRPRADATYLLPLPG